MNNDVVIPCFNGVINLSAEARKRKIDQTPGWMRFAEQTLMEQNCNHTMVYFAGGLCSSYEICIKCGLTIFDGGYPT